MYTIGEFSKITGISVATLRYYDERGVIVPKIKKVNGYRYYDEPQLLQAQFVNNLKVIGLPLEEISAVVEAKDPTYTLQKLSELKYKMMEQVKALTDLEKYFARGVSSRDEMIISRDTVENGILEGCKFIYKKIEDLSLRQVFTFDCLELQNRRNELGLLQKSGMRIVTLKENNETWLIMPLFITDSQLKEIGEKTEIRTIAGYETISIIVCKDTFDFSEETTKLIEVAKELKINVNDVPIIECLLDPGDVPDMKQYVARLHFVIQ